MKLVYLLSSLIEKISILVFIISTFMNLSEILIIVSMTLSIWFFVLKYILFAKYTNLYHTNHDISITKYNLPKFDEDEIVWIDFVFVNGVWETNNVNNMIRVDLKGYVFPKSFIIAYLTRQFRYPVVNKEKALFLLFKRKVTIPRFKHRTVLVRFSDGNNITVKKIIDKGISKISFLERSIIQSRYYTTFLFMQSALEAKRKIGKLDEKKYNKGIY